MDQKAKRDRTEAENTQLLRLAKSEIEKLNCKYKGQLGEDLHELCNYKLALIWDKIDIHRTPGSMIYKSIDRYLIRYISQNKPHLSLNLFQNITVTEHGYEIVELNDMLFRFLKKLDPIDQRIVVYLVTGYRPRQISKLLHLDLVYLLNRIARNRKLKWKSAFREIKYEKIREPNTYQDS